MTLSQNNHKYQICVLTMGGTLGYTNQVGRIVDTKIGLLVASLKWT